MDETSRSNSLERITIQIIKHTRARKRLRTFFNETHPLSNRPNQLIAGFASIKHACESLNLPVQVLQLRSLQYEHRDLDSVQSLKKIRLDKVLGYQHQVWFERQNLLHARMRSTQLRLSLRIRRKITKWRHSHQSVLKAKGIDYLRHAWRHRHDAVWRLRHEELSPQGINERPWRNVCHEGHARQYALLTSFHARYPIRMILSERDRWLGCQ